MKTHLGWLGAVRFVHRVCYRAARALATFGAIILVAVALSVSASILRRVFTGQQIFGDYEIVSMGSALAILLFLPLCVAMRGHVSVTFFTEFLPARHQRRLDTVWLVVLAVAAAILVWRLNIGLQSSWSRNEVTGLLRLPLFLVNAAAVVGAAGTSVLAVLEFVRDVLGYRLDEEPHA
jgi:TRAP-type C4-dicarboxylate transport system permease small subunit